MKAWIVHSKTDNTYMTNDSGDLPYEGDVDSLIEEGVFLSNETLRTHNEKIARAAFEIGRQKGTHTYNRFDGNDIDIEDFLQSPEYKELVGVK